MTFERGQTFSFHGKDSRQRAEALIREAGSDAVEIVFDRGTETKVRMLRAFLLMTDAAFRCATAGVAA